ncbi:aromatic acid exporter family protein [Aerococcaceae bacterium DSM 111020]|nr:aromatic acid exporter family protein [Aerococcaceae bacterium DSM 111020]
MNYQAFKIALAAVLSIVVAQWFQLENATAAGIIAVLTALETRQASFERGLQYIIATLIAFAISTFTFYLFGITVWSFGLYLLLFVPVATHLNLKAAIPPISVLVTHFLVADSISWFWHLNGFSLMLIGVIFANTVNIWMPDNHSKIMARVDEVEDLMRDVLWSFGRWIRNVSDTKDEKEPSSFVKDRLDQLSATLEELNQESLYDYNNQMLDKNDYYLEYTKMRKNQLTILEMMCHTISHLNLTTKSNQLLADLFDQTANELDEDNTGNTLLMQLAELSKVYQASTLPTSRREFESRALLYHLLLNFEAFLKLKHDFYREYGHG